MKTLKQKPYLAPIMILTVGTLIAGFLFFSTDSQFFLASPYYRALDYLRSRPDVEQEPYIRPSTSYPTNTVLNAEPSDIVTSYFYRTNIQEREVESVDFSINGIKQSNNLFEFREDFDRFDTGIYINPKKDLRDGPNEFYLKITFKEDETVIENREIRIYDLKGPEIISMVTAPDKRSQDITVKDTEEIKVSYYQDGQALEVETLRDLGEGKHRLVVGDVPLDNFVYHLKDKNGNTEMYSTRSMKHGREAVEFLVPDMRPREDPSLAEIPQLIKAENVIHTTREGIIPGTNDISGEGNSNLQLSATACEYRAKFVSFYLYDDSDPLTSKQVGFSRALANLNQTYHNYIASINAFNSKLIPIGYAPITYAPPINSDFYIIGLEANNLGPLGGILEWDYYYDFNDFQHQFPIYTGGVKVIDSSRLFSIIEQFNNGSLQTQVEGFIPAVTNPINKELILVVDKITDASAVTSLDKGIILMGSLSISIMGHEMGHSLGLAHWDDSTSNQNLMNTHGGFFNLEWNQLERMHAALCGDPSNKISLEGRYGAFGVNLDSGNYFSNANNVNTCGDGLIGKNNSGEWEWCENSFEDVPLFGTEICANPHSRPIVTYPSIYSCNSDCTCSDPPGGTGSEPPFPEDDTVPPGGGSGTSGPGPSTPPGGGGGTAKRCSDAKPKLTLVQGSDFTLTPKWGCPKSIQCSSPDVTGPAGPDGEAPQIEEAECGPNTSQLSPGQQPYSCSCNSVSAIN